MELRRGYAYALEDPRASPVASRLESPAVDLWRAGDLAELVSFDGRRDAA